MPPFSPLTDTAIRDLFAEADALLEKTGLDVPNDPAALAHLDAAGARIDGHRVRFPAGLAGALLRDGAPARFHQHGHNPQRTVEIGGGHPVFAPVSGPPFVHDAKSGRRRYATLEDFQQAARMVQASAALDHAGGGYCEPSDRDASTRHLDMLHAQLTLTDKPILGAVRDGDQIADSLEMARIAADSTEPSRCYLLNLFNIEPPLVLPGSVAAGIRQTATAGQACLIASYSMLGMTSPIHLRAALAQMLAEVQAGATLVQSVRRGAPVVCGIYAVPFSMTAMRPAFGAVEGALAMAAGAQLVRQLGVPFRADGAVTSAKTLDAQAGRDSALGLGVAQAIASDFVLHSVGWLEAGMTLSFDKFAHDLEVIEALREGRGDTHGSKRSVEQGRRRAGDVAPDDVAGRARGLLARWREPTLDPGIAAELDHFVAERRARYQRRGAI